MSRMNSEEGIGGGAEQSARIMAWSRWLQERHWSTWAHGLRVGLYAQAIGRVLGFDSWSCELLKVAGALHDLGKGMLPHALLDKPGRLSAAELQLLRRHPEIGYELVSGTLGSGLGEAMRFHHERWDGSGYPLGLRGREIPRLARIMSVADSYDAMVSGRPYRGALSCREALCELKAGAWRQFDGELVDAFLASDFGLKMAWRGSSSPRREPSLFA